MPDMIKDQVAEILSLMELKMATYLKLCETKEEKLFLLSYFNCIFDKQTAAWFAHSFEPSGSPAFQYPGQEDCGYLIPERIKWYEPNNMEARKAIETHLYELVPKYKVSDEEGTEICRIDFALFYPRTDRIPDKIKIAISFARSKGNLQTEAERVKVAYLRSKGWIVAHFTGSDLATKDVDDLIDHIETLALNKDEKLFYQTEPQRKNWQLN